jgi:hypothetical protein
MSEANKSPRRKKPRPLLVGIIIDASSSMSRNWKNKSGKSLPKIEVIRDAFNEQFTKISLMSKHRSDDSPAVHVFCLGMGFVLPQAFISVRTGEGKEETITDGKPTITRSDIICDLIALSEIVPSRALLERVRINLNKRWGRYSGSILDQASIEKDVFSRLQSYIRDTLRLTATSRLEKGWRISLKGILEKTHLTRLKTGHDIIVALDQDIQRWREKILADSDTEADRFFSDIIKHANDIFQTNQQNYTNFILESATEFATHQCQMILELLTLGYDHTNVLNTFDEAKALDLAKTIYQRLDSDVRKSIALAWNLNKVNLIVVEKGLGGTLDHKQIKQLTEQCIQKQGWSILKPFVEQVVTDLFVKSFEEQAKLMLPRWLQIAGRREVIRPIRQIATLLPETSEKSVYSNEYMFGSTPIDEALERSTHRFLDKANKAKQKMLLIISDGEYESNSPIYLADMLKSTGVTIVCCYISNRNVVSELMSKFSSRWPKGAQTLFQMASTSEDDPDIAAQLSQSGIAMPDNAKLFIQVNHSDILGKLVDALMISDKVT